MSLLSKQLGIHFKVFLLLERQTRTHSLFTNCLWSNRIDPYHSAAMLSLRRIKKLCFCTVSLTLNSRLVEACCAKTKFFIPPRLNMAAE